MAMLKIFKRIVLVEPVQYLIINLTNKKNFNESRLVFNVRKSKTSESTIQKFHAILISSPQYANRIVDYKGAIYDEKIVKASVKLSDTIVKKDVNSNVISLLNIFSNYNYPIMHDKFYRDLIIAVSSNVGSLQNNVIIDILNSLLLWIPLGASFDSNVLKLLTAIDSELVNRLNNLSYNDILFISDIWYWYSINNKKMFKYNSQANNFLMQKLHKLESSQIIQVFFYCCYMVLCERSLLNLPIGIELRLSKILPEITVNELGIISLGLFLSNYQIKNVPLLCKVVEKFADNLKDASDVTITQILKFLSQSLSGRDSLHYELCAKIFDSSKKNLSSFDHFSLVRLLNLGNHLMVFDDKMQETIFSILFSVLIKLRIKDLESVLLALLNCSSSGDIKSKLTLKIINELRKSSREREKVNFSEVYLTSVYYLACLNHGCEDLISDAINLYQSQNMRTTKGLGDTPNFRSLQKNRDDHLFKLAQLIDIEHLDVDCKYRNLKFSEEGLFRISQKIIGRLPSHSMGDLTRHEQKLLELKSELHSLLGKNDICDLICILPHFPIPDIIFCTSRGRPVSVPSRFLSLEKWKLKRPCVTESLDDLEYNAVIFASGKSFTHGNNDFSWTHKLKSRQLEKIGFKVSVVSFKDLLSKDSTRRRMAIKNSLRTSTIALDYL